MGLRLITPSPDLDPMSTNASRRIFLANTTAGAIFAALSSHEITAAEPSPWKAGIAKAVITPDKPVWLAGYGSKRPPDGKIHDLWMKALALEDAAGQRVVLITSDFQGVPRSMSDRVFAQLAEKYKLARSQVM